MNGDSACRAKPCPTRGECISGVHRQITVAGEAGWLRVDLLGLPKETDTRLWGPGVWAVGLPSRCLVSDSANSKPHPTLERKRVKAEELLCGENNAR
jgi:hypothetical protein